MLAVFEKAIGNPPKELSLPSTGLKNSKSQQDIAENFQSLWPDSTFYNLSNGNFMAVSHEDESPLLPRSIAVIDDIFCIFIGTLENMSELKRHYGLSRQATEAMVLIEAYKVLRDRAPYPPDQVIKDLEGKFAFVLFDARSHIPFAGRDVFLWREAGLLALCIRFIRFEQLCVKTMMENFVELLFRWTYSHGFTAFRVRVVLRIGQTLPLLRPNDVSPGERMD